MKKITTIIMLLTMAAFMSMPSYADMQLSAQSAILMCADTGDVLYEKNADEHMLIASTTKIMTAIVVIENCNMDDEVLINTEWCCIEGSSMYLEAGKSYTVKELLTGMMLTSGNDAAMALACYVSGSAEEFAHLMNEKAEELGMTESSFENPHGLDGEKQYSTARDMAVLAQYCMNNSIFREICGTKTATIGELTFVNHNKLLWNCEGCKGIKTGYTMAAGRTLVSFCERNGMGLVCVTLNAPEDWDDHMKLYEWGFSQYSLTSFRAEDFHMLIPAVSGISDYAYVSVENDIVFLTDASKSITVETEAPRFVFAGGFRGEKAGILKIYIDGELAVEEDLVYTVNNEINGENRLSLMERLLNNQKPYYIAGN